MIGEFDNGLVLVNPSDHPYTFDLEKLTAGKRYRRLRGSPQQDPQINNGAAVEGPVPLGPRDGLFLGKNRPLNDCRKVDDCVVAYTTRWFFLREGLMVLRTTAIWLTLAAWCVPVARAESTARS